MFKIIARKPVPNDSYERVVIDRGEGHNMRFVSVSADEHSLAGGEWFWGHYFITKDEAISHFKSRL